MAFPFSGARHKRGAGWREIRGAGPVHSRPWYNLNQHGVKYAQKGKRPRPDAVPPIRNGEMKDHHGCPVQASINVLSGKWTVQILWHLSFGPRRYAELRKKPLKISEKVLTGQLRELERDDVLHRKVNSSIPPRVTNSLNAEGEKLVPLMETLCNWGSAHFGIKPNLPRPAERS
jgi:DNA-binding HxlR family transcriptional regulator